MRIHHVLSSIDPKYGGPSYSVPALCNALAEAGHEVTLHVYGPVAEAYHRTYAIRAYHWSKVLPRLGFSRDMLRGLRSAARDADIMHVHGLWMLCDVWPAWAVKGTACKLVASPRGMLDAWALRQSTLPKRVMWLACQRAAVQAADLLHATAQVEAEGVWKLGIDSPAAVIANGVDIPPAEQMAHFAGATRKLLFLGRVHPKKGIDRLISAWARVQTEFPEWELQVAGPDNTNYLPELVAHAQALGAERLTFLGATFGDQKRDLFRDAQLFILPTHSENFGISVAEALSYGLPAIVSHGAPWAGLEKESCGLWVDNEPTALAAALRATMTLAPAQLQSMGARGRDWMIHDFSWQGCARMMIDSYCWLAAGGARPPWVLDSARSHDDLP